MRRRLGTLLKAASAGFDLLRPPGSGLVVLIYHRVGAHTASAVDLPRDLFARQMAHLATHHQVLTMDAAADALETAGPPPGRPAVVVTFDDGTADIVDEALPVLVEHRIPALVYLATDFIEQGREFPAQGRPASWAALADAVSTGWVSIGSHTHTHRLLDRVDARTAADELDRSIGLIGERLGLGCEHFAYPKALPGSPAAEAEVRARFRTAALGRTRPNPYGRTDLHRLTRSPLQTGDGMRWFRAKAAGGLALENDLRDLLNRRRYAGSVT